MVAGKKLHDMKAASVYIKMDIPLFKIRCNGLSYFDLGVHFFYRIPCGIADTFAVNARRNKQDLQLTVDTVYSDDNPADGLSVLDDAVGIALSIDCPIVSRKTAMSSATCGHEDCIAEHGLSLYIETEKRKLLLGTGQTDAVVKNAETSGIDLSTVDTVVLSHGHYDHSGSILPFSQINHTAQIIMQKSAAEPHFNGEATSASTRLYLICLMFGL